jgi:hypothetical protein
MLYFVCSLIFKVQESRELMQKVFGRFVKSE